MGKQSCIVVIGLKVGFKHQETSFGQLFFHPDQEGDHVVAAKLVEQLIDLFKFNKIIRKDIK